MRPMCKCGHGVDEHDEHGCVAERNGDLPDDISEEDAATSLAGLSESLSPACDDCGLPYGEPGFADLVVPHDVWAVISPTGDEGGLLCPTCLVRAAEAKGIEAVAVFRSGPFFAEPPQPSALPKSASDFPTGVDILRLISALEREATNYRMIEAGGGAKLGPDWARETAKGFEAAVTALRFQANAIAVLIVRDPTEGET